MGIVVLVKKRKKKKKDSAKGIVSEMASLTASRKVGSTAPRHKDQSKSSTCDKQSLITTITITKAKIKKKGCLEQI